ncbi:MAG TPA: ceramidase domain-containing protein [Candidatus Nanopelagicales bacterium]
MRDEVGPSAPGAPLDEGPAGNPDARPPQLPADRRLMALAALVTGLAWLGLWWVLVGLEGWADQARPATCLATHCFCEAVGSRPVLQPADTLSSLAYVAVGTWALLALLRLRALPGARSLAGSARLLVPAVALVLALVGLSSALYHATLTFLGQYLDVLSMYLLGVLLLTGGLVRAGWIPRGAGVGLFVVLVGALAVAQAWYPESRRVLFGLVLLPGILLELRPGTSGLPRGDAGRRTLWTGVWLLVVAAVLWVLDEARLACWPDSPLQGHAAWHVLTAAAGVTLLVHYAQSSARGASEQA